jgi:hypothetical protein
MNFRAVFIAIVIATGLIVSAYLINSKRPSVVVEQPSADFVRASGKCAECHRNSQYSIVHEYEMSKHAQKGVTCLDCHQVQPGQTGTNHNGFVINTGITPANCKTCHAAIYDQFVRSRHAAPSWVAVMGNKDFSPEMITQMEILHPGSMIRPPHPLTKLEGDSSTRSGCITCHAIGKPNADGSIGRLHALSYTAHIVGGSCQIAKHLRPVPPGPGSFADGNLHAVKAWHHVCSTAEFDESEGTLRHLDDEGHVHPHLRDVPHERTQRTRRHARPVRTALI